MVERHVHLRHPPGRGWDLAGNAYIGRGAILDVWPGATFKVGSGTKIMQYVSVGVRESVILGNDVQIAEFTSIRDADHGTDTAGLISASAMVARPILIGDNTWVGRGCAIIAGASLGSGNVVAANSVVRTAFSNDLLIAGAPAVAKRARRISTPE